MTRTIVVPLDRSPVAESALPMAIALAKQTGARLTLLSVIDLPFEFAAWLDATTIIDEKINVEDAYADYLEGLASEIDDVQVETIVRIGGAASEIERYVETLEDPVVVMASHGRTGISRLLIGSVTQQVVHRIHTPVIIVPARVPEDMEHVQAVSGSVLIPLDGSPFAEYALDVGLRLVGTVKPQIHLLRVIEMASWYGDPYAGINMAALDDYIDSSREDAAAYLDTVAERLRADGYTVRTEIRVGLAADQIEAVAESQESDMIIMATHGRSGVGRLLFGSVAERVLRQITTPLLLIRPDAEALENPETLADSMVAVRV